MDCWSQRRRSSSKVNCYPFGERYLGAKTMLPVVSVKSEGRKCQEYDAQPFHQCFGISPANSTAPIVNAGYGAKSAETALTFAGPDVTDNFGILAIGESELAEVNEDTSTLPQSTTAPPSTSNKRIPRSYKVEAADDDEEIYFALFCLFTDLSAVRDFLLDLWYDYRCGETDLVTASLTTNLSFELVRQVEKDLFDSFPVFKSYKDLWSIFYMFMCHQRGIDIQHLQQKFELVPQPMRVGDLVYMNIYRMLAGFCDVLQPHHAPIYRPGHYGIYDPNIDRGQPNDSAKIKLSSPNR